MNLLIGIDPGVKTGVALSVDGFIQHVLTKDIDAAKEWVLETINNHPEGFFMVRIENPNLRKWYGNNADAKRQGAGSIKRDYSIWKKFLEHHAIPYQDVAPKSIKTKLNAQSFKNITGWQGQTSEHSRDAAMMIFGIKLLKF